MLVVQSLYVKIISKPALNFIGRPNITAAVINLGQDPRAEKQLHFRQCLQCLYETSVSFRLLGIKTKVLTTNCSAIAMAG